MTLTLTLTLAANWLKSTPSHPLGVQYPSYLMVAKDPNASHSHPLGKDSREFASVDVAGAVRVELVGLGFGLGGRVRDKG